jgi:hypothetical protein
VATEPVDTGSPEEPIAPGDGPTGWIGSPCETVADCPFDGATCLLGVDGYPAGMCTVGCDEFCSDADGHPVTFCVDDSELPANAPALADGACHSRCDFGYFPETGCRPGYGCSVVPRPNGGSENYACVPGEGDVLPTCYAELAAAGVRFEASVWPDRSPDSHPNLTCHVEDPVVIRPPIHGVDILTTSGDSIGLNGASCGFGLSLSDTVLDAKAHGAEAIYHIGVYNCRVIGGTDTLSQHGNGEAIDIWGVGLEDGSLYSLVDDWEHDTTAPMGPGGAWLYDAAYRWYDAEYWNIILTPNYNLAHDDHFHVDRTPGGDFIGFTDGRYIGPAPYVD